MPLSVTVFLFLMIGVPILALWAIRVIDRVQMTRYERRLRNWFRRH